jgi:hypothetical protein
LGLKPDLESILQLSGHWHTKWEGHWTDFDSRITGKDLLRRGITSSST